MPVWKHAKFESGFEINDKARSGGGGWGVLEGVKGKQQNWETIYLLTMSMKKDVGYYRFLQEQVKMGLALVYRNMFTKLKKDKVQVSEVVWHFLTVCVHFVLFFLFLFCRYNGNSCLG